MYHNGHGTCEKFILGGVRVEQFDVLDRSGNLMGFTAEKGTKLKAGQYYLGTHAYIYSQSFEFLIQQRSFNKNFLPGGWDVHLEHTIAGETSADCVCRGLKEEIGLTVDKTELKPPKRFFWHEYNHIVDVYFIQINFNLERLSLDNNEVINVKVIPKNEMINLVAEMYYRPSEYRQYVTNEIRIANVPEKRD